MKKKGLTLSEVAERKGVTRACVWQAIKGSRLRAGKAPSVFGDIYIVSERDADAWTPQRRRSRSEMRRLRAQGMVK